jgi:hypothetical protein
MTKTLIALALLMFANSSGQTKGVGCEAISGWMEIANDPKVTWVVMGEMHGNNESPDIFADAVCAASVKRKVIVAVEQSELEQGAIDKYISSDGGEAARAEFLNAALWKSYADGRTSAATFDLFERLRQLKGAGRISAVSAFVPDQTTKHFDQAAYEVEMAKKIRALTRRGALVMVLTGNVHAGRIKVSWSPNYLPMAAHLPSAKTVTFNIVANGGTTWSCQGRPMKCASHELPSPPAPFARHLTLAPGKDGNYSGILYVGTQSSSSPPKLAAEQ